MVGNIFFGVVKNLSGFRISSHISTSMQSAVYDRLFRMPQSFFRDYDSADLAQRAMQVGQVSGKISQVVFSMIPTLVFAIVYFIQMITFSPLLAGISIAMVAVYAVVSYFIMLASIKKRRHSLKLDGEVNAKMYQFIDGISKIRIAGVEDRAIYEYLVPYTESKKIELKTGKLENINMTIQLLAESVFIIVLYLVMGYAGVAISMGAFIAFNTAFGSFSGSVMQLVEGLCEIKELQPVIERMKPVFVNEPETAYEKEMPGDISGSIEISKLSFAYSKDMPLVLDELDLDIKAGEYVGIVGSSGCGKSTLLKLLLGFERPTKGKIYYDKKDIENLDNQELRKKFGVVLQNGQLISGSIAENITITSPSSSLKDVEAVVKSVGLEEDIKRMPMGLQTIVSENCGTISGGQQQRILIARALIGSPRIIFFDEATSALDNITQATVSKTLDSIKATKIVIAHRLSTIKNCDRIIVLDKGKIREQGTYQELMDNKGMFYELAIRQI